MVLLSTIICISSDPCQEYILLATNGNTRWRVMEANFLELLCPAESLLRFVEVKRRASSVLVTFFGHKCYLSVMYLCYHPEELNLILFFLLINFLCESSGKRQMTERFQ